MTSPEASGAPGDGLSLDIETFPFVVGADRHEGLKALRAAHELRVEDFQELDDRFGELAARGLTPVGAVALVMAALLWAFAPGVRRTLGRISASRAVSVPFTWASDAIVVSSGDSADSPPVLRVPGVSR